MRKNKNPAHKVFVETVIKTIQKNLRNKEFYNDSTNTTEPFIPNRNKAHYIGIPKSYYRTVFAIASFQKQKIFFLGKSWNFGSLVDEEDIWNHSKAFNKRAWQRRANRVLRNAALGITVPSTLMMGLQIVLMALSNGDTKSVDIAVVTLLSALYLSVRHIVPISGYFQHKGLQVL